MKILIVDDDNVFVDTMRKILILQNHVITTAFSGEEALEKIEESIFDIIFTDLKMPKISGVDLIKKIREKGIESIIIVITGYGSIESAVEAMKFGAYDYFQKPFEKSTLMNKIKEVELEIQLRTELGASKIIEQTQIGEKLELVDLNDYNSPFLLISDDNPNAFITKFNLSDVTPLWLNYQNVEESINPSKLNFLKSKIQEFVNQNKTGTIILKGIHELLKTHNWENIKKFIIYLNSEIITTNFTLVILVENNIESLEKTQQSLVQDAISILINPTFKKIIDILSHPLRKNIITLLNKEKSLNYIKIMDKLNVKRSSVLAFHLNKLIDEDIILKEESYYHLSQKGFYFSEIISQIKNLGLSIPKSQIKIFRLG